MRLKYWIGSLAAALLAMTVSVAQAELTFTYVSVDGSGTGNVEGDLNAVGPVTLLDADGGDMWNGGDNFVYLHEPLGPNGEKRLGDFSATVRVVSQTEAIDGRWGKAGIRASHNLTGNSANAVAQVYAGNGSQVDPPASGAAHNPVPARLAGRTQGDGQGGFERPILAADATEVPNNLFPEALAGGTNTSWLRLDYTEETNTFVAGIAPDVNSAPGVWSFSEPATDIPRPSRRGPGWIVGLAYSAHSDLDFTQVTRADGFHGVTFDNFSVVPEPGCLGLMGLGLLGLLGCRRRRR